MRGPLNLASRPFLNRRPVVRFRILAWSLSLILLAVNAVAYRANLEDSTELRQRLSEQRSEIDAERQEVLRLRNRLAAVDPEKQNARVAYLNRRIAERTFPWGRLFDQLGEVMPRGVRLRSLNPTQDRRAQVGVGDDAGSVPVRLSVSGTAEDDEDLYEFVDALYGHPAFEQPALGQEASDDRGQVGFSLTVLFRPDAESVPAAAEESGPVAAGAAR